MTCRPTRRRNTDRRRIRTFRSRHIAGAALALVLMSGVFGTAAQDVTEPALKAAFIYNFAKFTEWPADVLRPGMPLVMCVLGDPAVADALEHVVARRDRGGHAFTVRRLSGEPPTAACHLLYVSRTTAPAAAAAVAPLRDKPVLTISDVEGFTDGGGIAYFYFLHGQLRFYVQPANLKRSGLEMSSRLLQLSKLP